MKKITRLSQLLTSIVVKGNSFKRFALIGISIIALCSTLSATQYCQQSITSGGKTVLVSLTNPVTNTYVVLIESTDVMTGLYNNIWANNVNGVQAELSSTGVLSNGGKTITMTINSTTVPSFYTTLMVLYPGLIQYTWPAGITWGTCVTGPPDTEIPTAFTATKGAVTSSTVELLLTATDNSGAITYTITNGATVLTTSGTSAVQKSYIVTGLTASTAYTFSVEAKDATGNAAVNNPISVPATTSVGLPTAPTTAAPTPPARSAAKVISIFSNAYTSIPGTTDYNPNWGQSTVVTTEQIESNATLKYATLNYQGTNFGSDVNAITMTHLHVDVWTANETSLQIFPISHTSPEKFYQLTPLTQGVWNTYDIPLTAFTSQGLTITNLYQFKFVGSGGKTVFLDNIYFYNPSVDVDATAPTLFTATAGTIASDAVELLLNATDDSGAISYTISYGAGPTVLTTSGVSATQKSYTVTGLSASTAYAFAITAKDATDNTAANSPITVNATTISGLPAAPTPTVAAAKVISIFSDAYTDVAGTNFYPGWGQSTVGTPTTLGENNAIKYVTFNFQGIQLASAVNASGMSKVHIDILPTTETTINFSPINTSKSGALKEGSVSLSPLTANQWNSFDILLSSIGVDMTGVDQFILKSGTGKTFYIDNLYFYDDTTTGLNTLENSTAISCYPNPTLNTATISAQSEISELSVRNLLGQSVKTVIINSRSTTIDLSDVSAGHYFVTVKLANGKMATQKLIKL